MPPRRSSRRPRASLGAALLGLAAAFACGCGETRTDSALPVGTALVPLLRLVDAGHRTADPLTLGLPTSTVRDDTRYVLRAPFRQTLLWPKILPDRSGNRLLRRQQLLPEGLREAERLLVEPTVKVGSTWLELPPRVLPTRREGPHPSVTLQIPIPANPEGRKVVVSAQAYALGHVDLGNLEAGPLEIPAGAVLDFAVGVVEPDWGFDPVEFRVLACEADDCEPLFSEVYEPTGEDGGRWRDYRIGLGALAGRTRHLRFEAERLADEAPFSFPVWANPTLYAPAPRGEEVRNVILLSVDTLRADHLTSYGYRHDTAPFIEERFGRRGTLFETLVAAATITTPSHATMFTSLTPATHGTVDGMKMLPKTLPTLAEWVRHEGRDTAAITENGWLSIRHGFGRGFDRFVENRSPDIMDPEGQVDRTFAQAREWLTRHRDKRFFLFLHTFQVHTPYAPPRRYRELFTENPDGDSDPSPSHLRWMAEYDREIRYVDDELRSLFDTIDALGLADDTVFVLTSDHGEAFLEHHELEHGSRLDEEVVHVPLLVWGRGVAEGRRVAAPVAHLDLMPTILDLMGLPAPGWSQGLSLRSLLEGPHAEAPAPFATRPLYTESRGTLALGPERRMLPFYPPAFGVRVGQRKLARYRNADGEHRYEYYDLANDPGERANLYPEHSEAARDLFELLEGYEARGRALRARIDDGNADGQAVELDPRQEEKLRALGYLR